MLPGRKTKSDAKAICDRAGCGKPAVCKVCVEADSFGAEYDHLCQEHMEHFDKAKENMLNTVKECEWCRRQAVSVAPFRDPDEGFAGLIHNVCEPCRKEHIKKFLGPDIGKHSAIRNLKRKERERQLKEDIGLHELDLNIDVESDED